MTARQGDIDGDGSYDAHQLRAIRVRCVRCGNWRDMTVATFVCVLCRLRAGELYRRLG